MKNETVIAILATVVGIFIILLIIGMASPEEKMVSVPITEDVLVDFKSGFIEGCVEDGSVSYQACNCAYNELYKEYGSDGLIELSANYLKTEQLPERAIDVILKCIE